MKLELWLGSEYVHAYMNMNMYEYNNAIGFNFIAFTIALRTINIEMI